MRTLTQDVRYAIRVLVKKPGFTAVAVLTLALGIGANTAIFTVIDAALLRPLPYTEPERLVHLWETNRQQEFNRREASYPDYLIWREHSRSFEDVAGYTRGNFTVLDQGAPEFLQGASVTSGFFSVLGVDPALGRAFREGEDQPGAGKVVILSHGLWQRRFGGGPDMIGRPITLNGQPYTVVGILPAQFHFAPLGEVELWAPLNPSPMQLSRQHMHWLKVIARLRPGVSLEQAEADMNAVAARIAEQDPQFHVGTTVSVVDLHEQIVGDVKPVLLALLGAVGFVLLIVCANVANLLLTRAATRQREMAIRAERGASRARLVRQLLTESVVLAAMGGGLGVAFAFWGVDLLVAAIPDSLLVYMPYLRGVGLDPGVLGFASAVTLVTVLLFGLVPALQVSGPILQQSLKDGARASGGRGRHKLRGVLVVSEVAIAMVLLVGAGLMTRSIIRLLETDLGFNADNLLTFRVSLLAGDYSETNRRAAFHQQALSRIASLTGVQGVASVSIVPLVGGDTGGFNIEGQPALAGTERRESNLRTISPDYFRVMEIPPVRGRVFSDQDGANAPNVVIVNQTLADRFFPGEDPVGKRIIFTFGEPTPFQIVGVVGDEKVGGLGNEVTPVIYSPYLQDLNPSMSFVVRTGADSARFVNAIRSEIQSLDAGLPIYSARTMEQMIYESPAAFLRRYAALLSGLFALVALLLAVVGIYGVIASGVAERTQEIGIRMALGARKTDVLRLVLGQAAMLLAVGVGLGIAASFTLTRLISSLLYAVSATDALTFTTIPALFTAVAVLASYLPARRALKVDPIIALRHE